MPADKDLVDQKCFHRFILEGGSTLCIDFCCNSPLWINYSKVPVPVGFSSPTCLQMHAIIEISYPLIYYRTVIPLKELIDAVIDINLYVGLERVFSYIWTLNVEVRG